VYSSLCIKYPDRSRPDLSRSWSLLLDTCLTSPNPRARYVTCPGLARTPNVTCHRPDSIGGSCDLVLFVRFIYLLYFTPAFGHVLSGVCPAQKRSTRPPIGSPHTEPYPFVYSPCSPHTPFAALPNCLHNPLPCALAFRRWVRSKVTHQA